MTWQIQTIVDNEIRPESPFIKEHGLSILLTDQDHKILFDTGQGKAIVHNLEIAGFHPSEIDTVIISHGHYDHAGGLDYLLEHRPDIRVIGHPDVFLPRYRAASDGTMFNVGSADGIIDRLRKNGNFTPATGLSSPAPGLQIFSGIPAEHPAEPLSNRFLRKGPSGMEPDLFNDETAILVETDKGLYLITGCAHRGVLNTLNQARHLVDIPISGLIGGFHLMKADIDRVEAVCKALANEPIDRIIPGHCTGIENRPIFQAWLKDRLSWNFAGYRLTEANDG